MEVIITGAVSNKVLAVFQLRVRFRVQTNYQFIISLSFFWIRLPPDEDLEKEVLNSMYVKLNGSVILFLIQFLKFSSKYVFI